MKIVTADQMRRLEAETEARGISTDRLMENAGLAVAEKARTMLGGSPKGEHVLVLAGPGNNGGDGLVAARHLNEWGVRVHVCLCVPRKEPDPKLEILRDHVVDIINVPPSSTALTKVLGSCRLVIDALLGTGRARPISGPMREALQLLEATRARRHDLRVLALDIPSGLDADTGACDPFTPAADLTVTLGYPKVGLFAFPGAAKVGKLETVDIGIPPDLAQDVKLDLSTDAWAKSVLPTRPLDSNKGTFGRVMVVAGSARYVGAAYLACAGAIRTGAGLVTLAAPRRLVPAIAAMLPEVTFLPLEESEWGVVKGAASARLIRENLTGYNTLLVGCGLGLSPQSAEMVEELLFSPPISPAPRLVLDADGLNIVARTTGWWERVKLEGVLTPHPGEMRRLTGAEVETIQARRLDVARESAGRWGKVVLLKGALTAIASPDGQVHINPFANPGLASAGTGDVLAGVVAGLLAQGLTMFDAAALGAYVHGAAGESLRADLGEAGMAASDLLPLIPRTIKRLKA